MRYLIIIAISAVMTGCSTLQPIQRAYEGESRGKEKIGVLKKSQASEFWIQFTHYAKYIDNKKQKLIKLGGAWVGTPSVLHILPGKYQIFVICSDGKQRTRPGFGINVEAGYTYEIQCERTPKDKTKGRAYVASKRKTEELAEH